MMLQGLTLLHRHTKVQAAALLGGKPLLLLLLHILLVFSHNPSHIICRGIFGNVWHILTPDGGLGGAIVYIPHLAHRHKVCRVVLHKAHKALLHLILVSLHNGAHGHAADIG